MKLFPYLATFLSGIILGGLAGSFVARQGIRIRILSGPYSDYYGPARREIQTAVNELKKGNSDVTGHLEAADLLIKKSEEWTTRFFP